MPMYDFKCPSCGILVSEYREINNRNNSGYCPSCDCETDRHIGSECPHTDMKEYHKPIKMDSVAVQPYYQDELQQILGPDIEIEAGRPVARTRKEKLHILRAMGYQEGS